MSASEVAGWVEAVGLIALIFTATVWLGLEAWDRWQLIRGTKKIRR